MTALADRLRPLLEAVARRRATVTYAELASTAEVESPHTIHKTTQALELLMAEDAADGRPLLAAVVVSRRREDLPAPGFFQRAAEIGCYFGPDSGPQAATFHALELERVWAAFGTPSAD